MSQVVDSASTSITPRRIRHDLSTALSFLETSMRTIRSEKSNPTAYRLFAVGQEKLRFLVQLLDQEAKNLPKADGYNTTQEQKFKADHPDVLLWTEYFQKRMLHREIFAAFPMGRQSDHSEARVVGVLWQRFSEFMPWFLCRAAAGVSTNEKRHYVIQTAFEELGMRDVNEIHPEMFWDAAQMAGVTTSDREEIRSWPCGAEPIAFLEKFLLNAQSDSQILGQLLGLEIPARENIEAVFEALSTSDPVRKGLADHKFFQLHRQIEIEHVRLTVANFLRFCTSEVHQAEFVRGFDQGLDFWQLFWSSAHSLIIADRAGGSRV